MFTGYVVVNGKAIYATRFSRRDVVISILKARVRHVAAMNDRQKWGYITHCMQANRA